MDIEEFIKTTLKNIKEGIDGSSSNGGEKHYYLADSGVDFDLAVLVSSEDEKKSGNSIGGKIKVVGASHDSTRSKTEKSEYISRVKFSVRLGSEKKGMVVHPRGGTLNKMV